MKKIIKISVLALLSLFLVYCSGDDSDFVDAGNNGGVNIIGGGNNTTTPPNDSNEVIEAENARFDAVLSDATTSTFLRGYISGQNTGNLSGVTVTIVGTSYSTVTDSNGYFTFEDLQINEEFAVVKASLNGYFDGFRTFTPSTDEVNTISIQLLQNNSSAVFNASVGGTTNLASGNIKIDFPANTIVDLQGNTYTGNVTVRAAYIDPSDNDFIEQIPGALVGLNDENELGTLVSYGMATVELFDNSGNKVEIAKDSTVTLTLPATADGPESIPLWHFNEDNGLWIEAGVATKVGNVYVGQVNHFSSWNLDVFTDDSLDRITVTFKNENNEPLANQKVAIFSSDFSNGFGTIFTDSKGGVTLLNTPPSLGYRIQFECENIEKTLDGSGTITVASSELSSTTLYNFTGTLNGCDDATYNDSYFSVTSMDESISFSGVTDGIGTFELSKAICNLPNGNVSLIATVWSDNTFSADTIQTTLTGTTANLEFDFCGNVTDSLNTDIVGTWRWIEYFEITGDNPRLEEQVDDCESQSTFTFNSNYTGRDEIFEYNSDSICINSIDSSDIEYQIISNDTINLIYPPLSGIPNPMPDIDTVAYQFLPNNRLEVIFYYPASGDDEEVREILIYERVE